MNCKQCAKVIPDGFTDCPWCGATFALASGASSGNSASPASVISSAHNLLISMSIVSSGILFVILSYFATTRSAGPFSLENSGYFLGRCVGAILLAAIVVMIFWKIRGNKPRVPVQALIILTLSSLLTILSLAVPAGPRMKGIDEATIRRYSDVEGRRKSPNMPPAVQTKWDPAARALMKDVAARNQQYVSEISALDETAKPLYTPESFRDAVTIQQMIEQLHARLSVADKYTDWQPVFSKMKDYVAAVDASEDEKREFMGEYQVTLPQTLAACKAISDKEHAWLLASLDLYQFALSKDGAYVWQSNNLSFKNRADSSSFRQKFFKARTLNTEFLKAYWEVRQAQDAMMAQLGMQSPGDDSSRPH
jgi:hypothetical protein